MQQSSTPAVVGALIAQGRAREAVGIAAQAVRERPGDPSWLHVYAYALHATGEGAEAAAAAESAIALAPAEAMFRNTLGAIELERGRVDKAERSFREALRLRPGYLEARFNLSQALHRKPDLRAALGEIAAILAAHPDFFPARLEQTKLLIESGEPGTAMPLLDTLMRELPHDSRVLLNAAAACRHLDNEPLALEYLERATAAQPLGARELTAAAETFVALGARARAVETAQRAVAMAPASAEIRMLAADVLLAANESRGACGHYAAVALLRPRDSIALEKLGLAYLAAGEPMAALEPLRETFRREAGTRRASLNLATALEAAGQKREARTVLAHAIEQGHGDAELLSTLAIYKARACEWTGLDELLLALRSQARVASNFPADPGHALYFEAVTARDQRLWAENWWAAHKLPVVAAPLSRPARGKRMRVGFLSADFRDHPTSRLAVAMLEEHDRDRFEFIAYSQQKGAACPFHDRLLSGFDDFVDVSELSARETARRIRADRLDVLLDMGGHTRGSRLDALALRPAPIQGHFLGYPGTTGAAFVDFFVTDPVASPPGAEEGFTERLLRMPRSCQPNDPHRALPEPPPRARCGLPDDALVLCSFNQPIKLTAGAFKGWCGLLRALPRARLWLLDLDDEATSNLRSSARKYGVDPERLVFAPHVAADEHIARLRNADIALDTYPCTSHTTASDALWAGVPLLTTYGDTFASRVASSVLDAAGLRDWCFADISLTLEATLALGRSADALAIARSQAAQSRASPLFDANAFARGFETLLEEAVELPQ